VPSPIAGTLVEIRVSEGNVARVGSVLAVINGSPSEQASPTAGAPSSSHGEPTMPATELSTAVPQSTEMPSTASASGQFARSSPGLRRLIEQFGLDLGSITGTGESGRITRRDVLDAAQARGALRTEGPKVGQPAVPHEVAAPVESRTTTLPMSPIRQRIAEHMVRSKAVSPHVTAAVEVDFERIESIRRGERATWIDTEGFPLTYLPFVARAACDALASYPHGNASVIDDTLAVHHEVHLAIAVDLDFEWLVAPVIRHADDKHLRTIAREIRGSAERARQGTLSPDDLVGGTFTITNPAPTGCDFSVPIINQPQVAILATNAVKKTARIVSRPDGSDAFAVRRVGTLSLSWDHRAFDGAYASAFLDAVRARLEEQDWSAELA
jgi:2-oxoglutarate dehydrogenase E2 component (dihydrolipoamide succinyltransferase)